MDVCVFASGSAGNCLLLTGGDTNILIDAGISWRRTVNCLAAQGLKIEEIGGVLITHEHSDHISGLKMLLRHSDIPLFAPRTVAAHLSGLLPDSSGRLNIIPVEEHFMLGSMDVMAFHTPHDTDESVGYRVSCGGVFALATDMGHLTREVAEGLMGAETVLIESNHDEEMLRGGRYPVYLKRRILSDNGHLSNRACGEFIPQLAASGTRKIILGHLSRENNSPHTALCSAQRAAQGLGLEIYCAPEFGELRLSVEERSGCLASGSYV